MERVQKSALTGEAKILSELLRQIILHYSYFSGPDNSYPREVSKTLEYTNVLFATGNLKALGQVFDEWAKEIRSEFFLQQDYLLKLPKPLVVAVFCAAESQDARFKRAGLIAGASELRALMLDAWKRRSIDELAALYGSAYSDGEANDPLRGARYGALDNLPRGGLRSALSTYDWPHFDGAVRGIQSWLKEALE